MSTSQLTLRFSKSVIVSPSALSAEAGGSLEGLATVWRVEYADNGDEVLVESAKILPSQVVSSCKSITIPLPENAVGYSSKRYRVSVAAGMIEDADGAAFAGIDTA